MKQRIKLCILILLTLPIQLYAQDPSKKALDLKDCISQALKNQPKIKQAVLDQEIGERDIASSLSGWFPQITATANLQHYLMVPVVNIGGNNIRMGQTNNSAISFQADQQIINASLMQANKAAKYVRKMNAQNTESAKIQTIVDVSKAYYDILTSKEQIHIIKENTTRTEAQLKDAEAKYNAGIVDKIDFKRASITLANTKSDQKRAENLMVYKFTYLKQLMGMNAKDTLAIANTNIETIESQLNIDTVQTLNYENRIELKSLLTQKNIQNLNTKYNKWLFLPSLSAFINYNLNYRANEFQKLYGNNFPSSLVGLSLDFPIFQGTKRNQEIKKSILMEQRLDLDLENMKQNIDSQYQQAIAVYKSNLNDWKTAKLNVAVSKEVYQTLKLQYQEGIKTYLDLMTAETDLRTSQLNYLNTLFNLLASKIEVDQALGNINTTND